MLPRTTRKTLATLATLATSAAAATTAQAAPLPIDPDEPPAAATDTAPRLQTARAYAAPYVQRLISQQAADHTLGTGETLRPIQAYAGSTLVDFVPVRELLADPEVAENYISGNQGLTCYDDRFAANVAPSALGEIVAARADLDVPDPIVDAECDPRTLLLEDLRDPETLSDNTSPVVFADIVRALLRAQVHVRASAVDVLAENATSVGNAGPETLTPILRALTTARTEGYGGLNGPITRVTNALLRTQQSDGSFVRFSNSRSTAVAANAAVALAGADQSAAAQRAAAFITTRQFSDQNTPRPQDLGAIALDYAGLFAASDNGGIDDPDYFSITTIAAIPGLIAGTYSPPPTTPETPGTPPATTPAPSTPTAPAPAPAAPQAPTSGTPSVRVIVRTLSPRTLARTRKLNVSIRTTQTSTITTRLRITRPQARRLGYTTTKQLTTLATRTIPNAPASTNTVTLKLPARFARTLRTARHSARLELRTTITTKTGTVTRTARVTITR